VPALAKSRNGSNLKSSMQLQLRMLPAHLLAVPGRHTGMSSAPSASMTGRRVATSPAAKAAPRVRPTGTSKLCCQAMAAITLNMQERCCALH